MSTREVTRVTMTSSYLSAMERPPPHHSAEERLKTPEREKKPMPNEILSKTYRILVQLLHAEIHIGSQFLNGIPGGLNS